jgi:hypothetical protein
MEFIVLLFENIWEVEMFDKVADWCAFGIGYSGGSIITCSY